MVMTSGSLGSLMAGALVCGRSTGTPTVKSGAVTMKMTSRTSITSTMGVTLISLMRRRWPVRPKKPASRELCCMMAMAQILGFLIQLSRKYGAELGGEGAQPAGIAAEIVRELVVGDHRRDRRHQAQGGGEESLGDARRHHGEAGVLDRGDRLEA